VAGFEAAGLVEPEPVSWPADDGTEVHGRLYRPQASAAGSGDTASAAGSGDTASAAESGDTASASGRSCCGAHPPRARPDDPSLLHSNEVVGFERGGPRWGCGSGARHGSGEPVPA
jgi:hypothetical protein